MKQTYFLSLLFIFNTIFTSEITDARQSQLNRKRKRLEKRIQTIRDKIHQQEAVSGEPAKFYWLLKEEAKLKEKIKRLPAY